MKRALITGITGQDGAYLSHLLLSKGYEVHGIRRRVSSFNSHRIDDILRDPHFPSTRLFLHYSDLTDPLSMHKIFQEVRPDEIYNLAAQSHVSVSFLQPTFTADINSLGTLRILEIARQEWRDARIYQASTSELFGKSPSPQNETTPFQPVSPYAVSKLFAFEMTRMYREAYGIFACNGILFNHESPLRGETFVTRKITRGIANWKLGNFETIYLGNLDSKRDWGHARDYVEMQWRMLQHESPEDFVIATGRQITIRNFIEICCQIIGLDLSWEGESLNERGIDLKNGKTVIAIDPMHFRPLEVEDLCGDATKAQRILGWMPTTTLEELAEEMIKFDIGFRSGKPERIRWLND